MNWLKKRLGDDIMNWLKKRLFERTSWDGAALITIGAIVLFLGPLTEWAAYAAIIYGVWTLWKKANTESGTEHSWN